MTVRYGGSDYFWDSVDTTARSGLQHHSYLPCSDGDEEVSRQHHVNLLRLVTRPQTWREFCTQLEDLIHQAYHFETTNPKAKKLTLTSFLPMVDGSVLFMPEYHLSVHEIHMLAYSSMSGPKSLNIRGYAEHLVTISSCPSWGATMGFQRCGDLYTSICTSGEYEYVHADSLAGRRQMDHGRRPRS